MAKRHLIRKNRAAMSDPVSDLLRKSPLFAEVAGEDLQRLAQHCRRRTYPANTALFHQDDPGQTMYLILSGRVVIERVHGATGEAVHIADRGPGEHFGEMALIDSRPRSADAVTRSECDLLMLDRADFLACLEQSTALALAIIRSLAERLRHTNDSLVALRTQDVLGRLALFLLEESRSNGENSDTRRIEARWTQQQIADRIGTTKESVNRALARLRRTGVVQQTDDGRLIIADPSKLRRYSGE